MRLVFIFILSFSTLFANDLKKVSVQLQWLDQFQFAGYYIAKEKGFYKKVGLDVEIKEYKFNQDIISDVMSGKTTFGIGRSSLLIDKSEKKDIVALSAIFQTSPLVLIALKSSNINSIEDFVGKKIMATPDTSITASIVAMMKSQNVDSSKVNFVNHKYNIQDLIDKKVDLLAAYITNEPFYLQEKGIEYVIFDPKEYGFDLYSDILYTSNKMVELDSNTVESFRTATLKGWKYAFSNIKESVDIIYSKYNSQNKTKEMLSYEANELKKLAYFEDEIGTIKKEKIQRTTDIYRLLGVTSKNINIDNFIYKHESNLNAEQRAYLNKKEFIKVCIDPYWKPFEYMEDGKYVGITADFLNQFSKIIKKEIRVVNTDSWVESIQFAKDRKCDMLAAASYTNNRLKFLDFTSPYLVLPYVIATNLDSSYIYELSQIRDKKIGMIKGYSYAEKIKEKFPDISISEFKTIDEGLKALNKGKIFAFIDTAATIGYTIRKKHYVNIKISGQLKDVWSLRVATRNDEPILNEVFQLAVDKVDKKIKNEILTKWQTINVGKEIDYALVWKLIVFFILASSIFFYLFNKLRNSKKLVEESLSNIEKILDTTIEAIAVSDEDNNIFIINNSALDIFGYTKEEFLSLKTTDIIAIDSLNVALNAFEDPSPDQYELNLIRKNGEVFPALASGKDIVYRGKKARVSTIVDLTTLKETQNELKKLNSELEIRVEEEVQKNIKKEKLLYEQSRLAQMGKMLSMIAHQWRQPLSALSLTIVAIKLRIELKKIDLDTEKGKEKFLKYIDNEFDTMLDTVSSLSDIIDDFRTFYKPDKKPISVNINETIKKSLNIIAISLKESQIEVTEELQCTDELMIHENEMMQVILNIIKNSQDNFIFKETQNSKLIIRSLSDKDSIKVEIEDNGGGIEDEVLPKIFDPYFSTKDEKNGTGLGLHMSKIIIEEHHKGNLTVKNTKEGVKFTIEIKK